MTERGERARHTAGLCAVHVLQRDLKLSGDVVFLDHGGEADVFHFRPYDPRQVPTVFRTEFDSGNLSTSFWCREHLAPHRALPVVHGLYAVHGCHAEPVYVTHREDLPDMPHGYESALESPLDAIEEALWYAWAFGSGAPPNPGAFEAAVRDQRKRLQEEERRGVLAAFDTVVSLHRWGMQEGVGFHDAGAHNLGWRRGRPVLRDLGCAMPFNLGERALRAWRTAPERATVLTR